ncbi:hypothetical protein C922_05150 [Plasmodium inui San Antonio 1]|uniref:Uncharacterized protein n=1 Tax=Plasmodium inui San Antonio 1 TaxID=1237626 RepID=W6ZU53_9APIC|nr:hypothetical protein C922_05150 [Plasmodium inui San Antonio 1]EUD64462.1 hypothetical protein C922_05150 [Plasmodium inui San Antonio 1]
MEYCTVELYIILHQSKDKIGRKDVDESDQAGGKDNLFRKRRERTKTIETATTPQTNFLQGPIQGGASGKLKQKIKIIHPKDGIIRSNVNNIS